MESLEKIHTRATKLVTAFRHKSYAEPKMLSSV